MSRKQETLWAFAANMYGPFVLHPVAVEWNGHEWSNEEDFVCVKKKGLQIKEGYATYLSSDKKEVETFINGFTACRKLLGTFVNDDEDT